MWISGLMVSLKSNTLKPKLQHDSWRSLSEMCTGRSPTEFSIGNHSMSHCSDVTDVARPPLSHAQIPDVVC